MGTIPSFPFLCRNNEVIPVVLHVTLMAGYCEVYPVSAYGKQDKCKISETFWRHLKSSLYCEIKKRKGLVPRGSCRVCCIFQARTAALPSCLLQLHYCRVDGLPTGSFSWMLSGPCCWRQKHHLFCWMLAPNPVVALSNLVSCVSHWFKERRDGYDQKGTSGTCSWEAPFCSLLGKGTLQELKTFHCYLSFCSVEVLCFLLSPEKRPASGKFMLSFFK